MSRRIRFIPEEGSLVEITCRTDQGRYLLRPDPVIDDILLGVLGRAQRLYPVEICGFSFLSSHYHLLLWVPDARSMARFMWYFQTNAAREVGRLTDWPNGVWSDRYTSIPVGDEPAAQVDRLRYVLRLLRSLNCPAGVISVRRYIGNWWRGWCARSSPTLRRKGSSRAASLWAQKPF